MGKILIPGSGGGGVMSDELTATAGDVLKGLLYVGKDTNDEVGTGTLELTGNAAVGDVISGKTFYNTNAKSRQTGTLALSGNITAQRVLSGYTGYATDPKTKITGSIPSYGGRTITPGTSNQVISVGNYISGNVTIAGDGDLIAANIKKGKNIFGVNGTCREFKQSFVQATSSSSSKSYATWVPGGNRSFYYLTINPGFTPVGFVAVRNNEPLDVTYMYMEPSHTCAFINSASVHRAQIPPSSFSMTSTNLEIPVYTRNYAYNVSIFGYA